MTENAREDFDRARLIASVRRKIENLEDECETFLNTLYDEVASKLACRFGQQLNVPNEDDRVNRIVWKQTARSATLGLLDTLVNSQNRRISMSYDEWVEECYKTLDFEEFKRETSFDRENAIELIDKTAIYLTISPALIQGIKLLYRGCAIDLKANGIMIEFERGIDIRPQGDKPQP